MRWFNPRVFQRIKTFLRSRDFIFNIIFGMEEKIWKTNISNATTSEKSKKMIQWFRQIPALDKTREKWIRLELDLKRNKINDSQRNVMENRPHRTMLISFSDEIQHWDDRWRGQAGDTQQLGPQRPLNVDCNTTKCKILHLGNKIWKPETLKYNLRSHPTLLNSMPQV